MEDVKEKELEQVSGGVKPKARTSKYLIIEYSRKEFPGVVFEHAVKISDIAPLTNEQYVNKWCNENKQYTFIRFRTDNR